MIIAGTALLAAGPLVVSFFGADSGYAVLVPGLVLTGIGAGFFYPSITTAAVTMLDASRSSLAGGITYMFQIAGGAIGLGLTTALFTSRSEDLVVSEATDAGLQMTGDQAGVIHGYLAGTEPGDGGLQPVRQPRSPTRSSTWSRTRSSAGSSSACGWSPRSPLVGLVIAILGVRPRPRPRSPRSQSPPTAQRRNPQRPEPPPEQLTTND